MKITESDVAVLIPAFGRPMITLSAIECALATGAGEVIVSEDASCEDMSILKQINDRRFRFVEQPKNLGLWLNHLALLRMTGKKWIKFLQTDDTLSPDCLKKMCEAVGSDTTLVSMLPVYKDLDTGKVTERYIMQREQRWANGDYVNRMATVGNEPGRPSYVLFRRDALIENEEAWRNDMSCDLVANVIAASRGEVVLLPPGGITCGIHSGRDGAQQSFDLMAARLKYSLQFLSAHSDSRVRRFVAVYGVVETLGLLRTFIGRMRRGSRNHWSRPLHDLGALFKIVGVWQVLTHPSRVWRYSRYKYSLPPIHIV